MKRAMTAVSKDRWGAGTGREEQQKLRPRVGQGRFPGAGKVKGEWEWGGEVAAGRRMTHGASRAEALLITAGAEEGCGGAEAGEAI